MTRQRKEFWSTVGLLVASALLGAFPHFITGLLFLVAACTLGTVLDERRPS